MTSSHAKTNLKIDDQGDRIPLTRSDRDRKRMADIVADARSLPAYAGSLDVHAIREGGLKFADRAVALQVPEDMMTEWIDAGGVPACWFRRAEMSGAPLLYLHGGGFCGGSVAASRGIAAALADAFAVPVLAVEYRQGPEDPFPAAPEDARAAYNWLTDMSDAAITLVGDSAGGTLAVGLALDLVRNGGRRARAVIASSGWFDMMMRGHSWVANRDTDLVTTELGAYFRDAYMAGAPIALFDASLRDGLADAPPLLIQMGGAEGCLDDAAAYAAEARTAGVSVQFEEYVGMPHNYVKFDTPIAAAAIHRMVEWNSPSANAVDDARHAGAAKAAREPARESAEVREAQTLRRAGERPPFEARLAGMVEPRFLQDRRIAVPSRPSRRASVVRSISSCAATTAAEHRPVGSSAPINLRTTSSSEPPMLVASEPT